MNIGIIISTSHAETVFNALRLGKFAANEGDQVGIFGLGKGVELEEIGNTQFDVLEQARVLLAAGGRIMACGTCLKLRNSEGSEICPLSTMKDLYRLIQDADRLVTL